MVLVGRVTAADLCCCRRRALQVRLHGQRLSRTTQGEISPINSEIMLTGLLARPAKPKGTDGLGRPRHVQPERRTALAEWHLRSCLSAESLRI